MGVHLQELAKPVMVEMWGYFPIEIEQGEDGEHRSCQIGHLEGGNFSNVSAYHHTDADTYVPRGEVGAGGCASLVVGSKVHEQGIVGREHRSEAYTQQQGDEEEHDGSHSGAP